MARDVHVLLSVYQRPIIACGTGLVTAECWRQSAAVAAAEKRWLMQLEWSRQRRAEVSRQSSRAHQLIALTLHCRRPVLSAE